MRRGLYVATTRTTTRNPTVCNLTLSQSTTSLAMASEDRYALLCPCVPIHPVGRKKELKPVNTHKISNNRTALRQAKHHHAHEHDKTTHATIHPAHVLTHSRTRHDRDRHDRHGALHTNDRHSTTMHKLAIHSSGSGSNSSRRRPAPRRVAVAR